MNASRLQQWRACRRPRTIQHTPSLTSIARAWNSCITKTHRNRNLSKFGLYAHSSLVIGKIRQTLRVIIRKTKCKPGILDSVFFTLLGHNNQQLRNIIRQFIIHSSRLRDKLDYKPPVAANIYRRDTIIKVILSVVKACAASSAGCYFFMNSLTEYLHSYR
jgi:hypothetical protein